MRQIKFKGYSSTGWVFGSLLKRSDDYYIIDNDGVEHRVLKNSIGQYSDYTDRKNTDIYEGDIVRFSKSRSRYSIRFEGHIKFQGGCFGLYWERTMLGSLEKHFDLLNSIELGFLTVLGNIFDENTATSES